MANSNFTGFNFDRPQDVNKSAKDSFAELAKRAPAAPTDKAALGQWFQQYIQGGMNDRGHKVESVNGDGFTYGNHEGRFTVDYGANAGAPNMQLAWQAEPADDATRARYPQSGGGAPSAPVNHAMAPVMPGQSSLMAQILASLQDQQADPQDLLLQQLR